MATRSFTNPSFGPQGLERLKTVCSATETVRLLIETDAARDLRQLAVVDIKGGVAAHNGRRRVRPSGCRLPWKLPKAAAGG